MYIYNVTVSIEKSLAEDWLNWMKTIHVPDVLNTGHFIENKICKVMNVDDEGATYSVQYTFNTIIKYVVIFIMNLNTFTYSIMSKYTNHTRSTP